METTISKTGILTLKKEIKRIAEEQIFLKDQRKTVHIKGERKLDPKAAYYKHQANRENLRCMYAAYGLMRGKKLSQIENHPEENHPLNNGWYADQIVKIMSTYTTEE